MADGSTSVGTAAASASAPLASDRPQRLDVDFGTAIERMDSWIDARVRLLSNIAVALVVLALFVGLGVSSVAIGFAFKDILQNGLAGLLILLRQPVEVGDQIVINSFEGTVERIETRATIIRTYDGQRVVVPNGDSYTKAVQVKTANDKRRSQYDMGLGYGDGIEHGDRAHAAGCQGGSPAAPA